MISRRIALIGLILMYITTLPVAATSATPQIADTADEVVSLKNVTAREDEVAGEALNNSRQTLRDVQLRILYSWRWNNEFRPGTDDPGRVVYQTIDREIPPGQSARFNYKPSPSLPNRKDGYFDVSVKVVDFTTISR
jgi:hypothetical protein